MNLMDTPIQLWFLFSGEDQHHYRQNISHRKSRQGPTVPWFWHGSNSTLLSPETKVSRTQTRSTRPFTQCESALSASPARSAGGTTTVERLFSRVSLRNSASSWLCNSSQRPSISPVCRFSLSN